MILHNFTPHSIRVADMRGQIRVLESRGIARVQTTEQTAPDLELDNGGPIATVTRTLGAVAGLPDPQPGVGLIVSSMVAAALPHRTDLFVPDTGQTARRYTEDDGPDAPIGQIDYVRRLIRASAAAGGDA